MAIIPIIILPPWIADYFNPPKYKGDIFDPPKFAIIAIIGTILSILIILDKKVKRDLIFWLVIAWLGQLLLASLLASNKMLSFVGANTSGGRGEGFIMFCFYAIFFISSKEYLRFSHKKLYTLGCCLLIVVVYALIQYYSFNTPSPNKLRVNPNSWDPLVRFRNFPQFVFTTIGNSNFVGTFSTIFFIFFTVLYVALKRRYLLLFSISFFALLLVSQARSAWLGSGFSLLIISALSLRIKSFRVSILFALFLFSCTTLVLTYSKSKNTVYAKSKTIFTKKNLDKYGGSGRIMIWNITIKIIQKHPLWGVGPEHLKASMYNDNDLIKLGNEYKQEKNTYIDKAHSEILQMAAIGGIPALILFLSIVTLSISKAFSSYKTNAISLALTLVIIAYFIQSLFNISVIAVAPIFWILLGALAGRETNNEIKFNILGR